MALSVTAGGPATSAQFNALVPTYLLQTADQPLATTTFTNHNMFSGLTINAGETWEIYFQLSHNSADVGNDIKVRLESTGTVALDSYRAIISTGLTATSSADVAGNFQSRAMTDSVSGGSTTSATVFALWTERFTISGGASGGTWGVEWAQAAAITGSTTVKAGSFLIARRVA